MNLSPGKPLPVLLQHSTQADRTRASAYAPLLRRLGRVETITILDDDDEPPAAATALLGELRLLVPMQGIIDVDAERARLEKQQTRLRADLDRIRGKLDNPGFVNNAPRQVVTNETARAAEIAKSIAQLTEQLEKLSDLA